MAWEAGKTYSHDTHGYQIKVMLIDDSMNPSDPYLEVCIYDLPGPLAGILPEHAKINHVFLESELTEGDWTEVV